MSNPETPAPALTPAQLQPYVQTAVHVELCTIPIYLFTYYSISRKADLSGSGLSAADQNTLGTYANKAGGVIMSVAVEEMLHMSLAGNLLRSLGGTPKFAGLSPGPYPTNLPHHSTLPPGNQGFSLQALSAAQLNQFLLIEQPEFIGDPPQQDNWQTLGQFYDFIGEQVSQYPDSAFVNQDTQLQGKSGYYAANNVDSIYPTNQNWDQTKPDPQNPSALTAANANYNNAIDTGDIFVISSQALALQAIKDIKHEGEGYAETPSGSSPDEYADKSGLEESHWYKFNELLQEYQANTLISGNMSLVLFPAFSQFPDGNPTKAGWSALTNGKSDVVMDLLNAAYSYLFLLTEVSYTLSGAAQHTLFYIGMHKGMIFVLDKLINNMRVPYSQANGTGTSDFPIGLCPTFENYPFKSLASARSELTLLAAKVNVLYPSICDNNIYERIQVLPNVNVPAGQPVSFSTPPPTFKPS
jgi:hypothetical protein